MDDLIGKKVKLNKLGNDRLYNIYGKYYNYHMVLYVLDGDCLIGSFNGYIEMEKYQLYLLKNKYKFSDTVTFGFKAFFLNVDGFNYIELIRKIKIKKLLENVCS